MNPVQEIISDIEAMRSSMGDTWFGPFSNEEDGHIEWPNLAITLLRLKAMPQPDAAYIVDKLCPVIAHVAGVHVSPKLSQELTIRLNDILMGADRVEKVEEDAGEITGTTSVARA
jgi:hypothetical protein